MAEKKDESSDAAVAVGVIVGAAASLVALALALVGMILKMIVGAVLGYTVLLTAFYIAALFGPLRTGETILYPRDARRFLIGGLAGGAALVIAGALAMLLGARLKPEWLGWLFVGGYVLGAYGTLLDDVFYTEESEPQIEPPPVPETLEPLPEPPAAPRFEYASWDDEEDGK